MIWALIVLVAVCLYLAVLLRRRDAALEFEREQYLEAKKLSEDAIKLNQEILEGQKEHAKETARDSALLWDAAMALQDERDNAHKMLEMALAHDLENNEAWDSVNCEIGINGVVYQFLKDDVFEPRNIVQLTGFN